MKIPHGEVEWELTVSAPERAAMTFSFIGLDRLFLWTGHHPLL